MVGKVTTDRRSDDAPGVHAIETRRSRRDRGRPQQFGKGGGDRPAPSASVLKTVVPDIEVDTSVIVAR
jgi:hypothetical protein